MNGFKSFGLQDLVFLLVDKDRWSTTITRSVLNTFSVKKCVSATSKSEMMSELVAAQPHIMLLEWKLKEENSLNLIKKIRSSSFEPYQQIPIIMTTSYSNIENVSDAINAGANDFVAKPFAPGTLYNRICNAACNPREFIDTKAYKGPDRRRRKLAVKTERRGMRSARGKVEWGNG